MPKSWILSSLPPFFHHLCLSPCLSPDSALLQALTASDQSPETASQFSGWLLPVIPVGHLPDGNENNRQKISKLAKSPPYLKSFQMKSTFVSIAYKLHRVAQQPFTTNLLMFSVRILILIHLQAQR